MALAIFGTAALALLAGLGAWVYEFLQNRRPELPEKGDDIFGAAIPRQPDQNYLGPKKPSSPIVPATLGSIESPQPPHPVAPPLIKSDTKSPAIDALTLTQKSSEPAKTPDWAKAFPSFAKHKERYSEKIPEPSPDLPKAVKHQSPLPEFGGMCTKCGENPKVPGNDGFCKECSPLD